MRKKEMQNSIYCLTDIFKHFQLIFENTKFLEETFAH